MRTHELWRERESGEVWAVRLVEGVVVGCCGPLGPHDREAAYLSGLDYAPEHADWIEQHREAFDLARPAVV